ncbi:MAG: class I SAM-dependent methyltransferase [Verrucomicrobiae bacterium]|nr:class I SAM-dependent methyltransferase [Verrucomicrobiae bacterium]
MYPITLGSQRQWLLRCQRCLSCSPDGSFSEQALHEFYASDYFEGAEWQVQKNRLLAADYIQKADACGLLTPGLRYLEIGASYGHFADACHRRTHSTVDVIELSRDCRRYIESRFSGIRILGATLDDVPSDRVYDRILCFHVIEHVPLVRLFLSQVAAHLAPGGRLLIVTPNAAARSFLRNGARWGWSCTNQHCTFLSPFIPDSFFQSAGFDVLARRSVRPAPIHTPSSVLLVIEEGLRRLDRLHNESLSARTFCAKVAWRVLAGLRPQFQQNNPEATLLRIERFFHRFQGANHRDELLLLLAKRPCQTTSDTAA